MATADGVDIASLDLDSDDVVTVSTLNEEIAAVVENEATLQHDYIVGDVSDHGVANGHEHFDLIHDGAKLHCIVFAYRRSALTLDLEDDMRVAVRGELDFFEPRGECSVIVSDAVALGESKHSQVYAQNRNVLKEDGLLDEEQKQQLPSLPSGVGLLTSADSDARADAVTSIHSRYPDVDIHVYDTSVQGDDAMQEIMKGLSVLDRNAEIDVIVLTRGGGADDTLRLFNELPLCRVLSNTDTPVCVGIGHENDRTLADEVADHRVMTPTHAGEIVPEKADLEERVSELREGVDDAYDRRVTDRLQQLERELDRTYERFARSGLQRLEQGLDGAYREHTDRELGALNVQLDRALEVLERQRSHEKAKQAAVEKAKTEAYEEARETVAAHQRWYKVALAVALLVIAILLVALYTT